MEARRPSVWCVAGVRMRHVVGEGTGATPSSGGDGRARVRRTLSVSAEAASVRREEIGGRPSQVVGRALVGDAAEYPRRFNFHVRLFEYA